MIGWILLAIFVIIWAAFLLPSWRRSPTSTVEEFEQRMSLLAEANRASPGRWVLVPRKGHRFLGPLDRHRARTRRRRRFVFVALLELTGLTLIMGLFQPLRPMLFATAILTVVLVFYVGMLLRFRMEDQARAHRRRDLAIAEGPAYTNGGNGNAYGARAYRRYGDANGDGADPEYANGYRNGRAGPSRASPGSAPFGRGSDPRSGNGNRAGLIDERYLPDHRYVDRNGIEIMDEDVHVIVRRSDEVDLQAIRPANGASAD